MRLLHPNPVKIICSENMVTFLVQVRKHTANVLSVKYTETNYSKTLKMTNFGTGHLQKIVIFKLLSKPSFARSFSHLGLFELSKC